MIPDPINQHPPAMRYFGKSLITNTINVTDGRQIPFIHIAAGVGVIATDDDAFIQALTTRITERRGGVWEMTESDYEEELKKKPATPSPLQPSSRLRSGVQAVPASPLPPLLPQEAAATEVSASSPAEVAEAKPDAPVIEARPTVGRVKRQST